MTKDWAARSAYGRDICFLRFLGNPVGFLFCLSFCFCFFPHHLFALVVATKLMTSLISRWRSVVGLATRQAAVTVAVVTCTPGRRPHSVGPSSERNTPTQLSLSVPWQINILLLINSRHCHCFTVLYTFWTSRFEIATTSGWCHLYCLLSTTTAVDSIAHTCCVALQIGASSFPVATP